MFALFGHDESRARGEAVGTVWDGARDRIADAFWGNRHLRLEEVLLQKQEGEEVMRRDEEDTSTSVRVIAKTEYFT